MSKKAVFFFITLFFFSFCHLAFAGLSINEVMYAPASGSAHEWLEVYNTGSDSIDLTDYRFFNNQNDSAPLRLQKGSAVLGSNEYAIVTKTLDGFISDWSSFSGTIFTSSQFSLPDDSSSSSTYKAISDADKQILDSITYDTSLGGSKDSGNSLSKISGSWSGTTPTPGTANETSSANNSDNSSTSSNSSTSGTGSSSASNNSSNETVGSSVTSSKTKTPEEPKVKTQITANKLVFVGIPVKFDSTAYEKKGEPFHDGKYFWNFGDGASKEVQTNSAEKIIHSYFYPGEYTVVLEYYKNSYGDVPDASDKMTVKVVAPDISISSVGEATDFFVELSNNTSYDADISNWVLSSNTKSFALPKNTILGAKKKIIFSSQITHFTIADKNNLKLTTPDGKSIFDYAAFLVQQEIPPIPKLIPPHPTPPQPSPSQGRAQKESPEIPVEKPLEIPVQNLEASAVQSDITTDNPMRAYMVSIVLTVFLGASAGAVYFIRRKKITPAIDSDFQILDESR